MIFNSLTYILFLVFVVSLYWVLKTRSRLILLFLASIVFYGFWRWEFTLLMLASTLTDYWVAQAIYRSRNRSAARKWLSLSLIINLGFLFVFKYLIFFGNTAVNVLNFFGSELSALNFSIILPLGISFYTFQTISYSVDVYRGFIKPEKNFFLFGSYVTFFPQLVAGPILRAAEVLPFLRSRPRFNVNIFSQGVYRISLGLFLKVVLADNVAGWVNEVFSYPIANLSATDVLTKSFLFGFQIYFDFAAYSHIAIGSALLMGIKFPENFNYPYAANSLKNFWKRWHISLSSWIRDYLYLPLQGKKVLDRSTGGLGIKVEGKHANQRMSSNAALFLTWAIMGLWHGANWTFVFWGVYHAIFLYFERKINQALRPNWKIMVTLKRIASWPITLVIAMLAWLPFREQHLEDVFLQFGNLLTLQGGLLKLSFRENAYLIAGALLIAVSAAFWLDKYFYQPRKDSVYMQVLATVILLPVTYLNVVFLRPVEQFIYFQF